MDSVDAVSVEDKNGVVEETLAQGSLLEAKDKDVSDVNGSTENVTEEEGIVNASSEPVESSLTVSERRKSGPSKGHNVGTSKKIIKDRPSLKGSVSFGRNTKPSLSQSLSFPARGNRPDATTKSTDGSVVKLEAKKVRTNGGRVDSYGIGNPGSRLNPTNRRSSTGVNSNVANTNGAKAPGRRSTLATVSSPRQSLSGKSASANETENRAPSESLSVDEQSKSDETGFGIKDDDAHSTTSSATPRGQRRNSASGFSFRLEERAEKRREFFSKLVEKTHAKEAEKTNIQEKSKEYQEAEIKQLRKALTFKATPMPTFYKEPPQKVELKKIPTTRPISPKLGRIKGSTTSGEVGGASDSPRANRDRKKSLGTVPTTSSKDVATKKTIRKSLSKIQSRESEAAKAGEKPIKPKQISAETESQDPKTTTGAHEESSYQSSNPIELENRTDLVPEKTVREDNGPSMTSSNLEIQPAQVTVGG